MTKRNGGYVLIYTIVVLSILEVLALSVMSMALIPQHNLVTSISKMNHKYAAQGLMEKMVAELEHATEDTLTQVLSKYPYDANTPKDLYCRQPDSQEPEKYQLVATYKEAEKKVAVATATIRLTPRYEVTTGDDGIGYTVTYLSYDIEEVSGS